MSIGTIGEMTSNNKKVCTCHVTRIHNSTPRIIAVRVAVPGTYMYCRYGTTTLQNNKYTGESKYSIHSLLSDQVLL